MCSLRKFDKNYPVELGKTYGPGWNEALIILFASNHFVEFSLKALMPFKVIQKYLTPKEMQFLPLGAVNAYMQTKM